VIGNADFEVEGLLRLVEGLPGSVIGGLCRGALVAGLPVRLSGSPSGLSRLERVLGSGEISRISPKARCLDVTLVGVDGGLPSVLGSTPIGLSRGPVSSLGGGIGLISGTCGLVSGEGRLVGCGLPIQGRRGRING